MKNNFALLALPLCLFSAQAMAIDYPDMKDGLWTTTVVMGKEPAHVTEMCVNHDLVKAMTDMAKGPHSPCKIVTESKSGPTTTTKISCARGNTTHTATNVMTMTGNTGQHIEVHSDDGDPQTVMDSKYTGSCPADMKPGDVVDKTTGMKMNVLAMPGQPPGPPGQ